MADPSQQLAAVAGVKPTDMPLEVVGRICDFLVPELGHCEDFTSEKPAVNNLASFASTCRHVGFAAEAMVSRQVFHLTVDADHIRFEKWRSPKLSTDRGLRFSSDSMQPRMT